MSSVAVRLRTYTKTRIRGQAACLSYACQPGFGQVVERKGSDPEGARFAQPFQRAPLQPAVGVLLVHR
jgi:hypothetical protein